MVCKIQISNDVPPNEKLAAAEDPAGEDNHSRDSDSSSASSLGEPPSAAFLVPSDGSIFSRPLSDEGQGGNPGCSDGRENFYERVISRSGISCRFNSSRTVRLRLLLSASAQNSLLRIHTHNSSDSEANQGEMADEMQCTSISQTTLIHNVGFFLRLHVTYLQSLSHTEYVANHSIALTILPPPAQLPEVDSSVDAAYRKKHDQPPAKTVRHEDTDLYPQEVDENHAGPSAYHPNAPPPPFDDAPPPFSYMITESAASSRLPTFLESENELNIPIEEHPVNGTLSFPQNESSHIEGEGVLFGFPASEQYDGHSDEMRRALTPPPAIDMSQNDTDVTELIDLFNHSQRVLDSLDAPFDQGRVSTEADGTLPPPPPPMDDPSDPPPSIDSDYRTRVSEPPPPIDSHYRLPSSSPPVIVNFPTPSVNNDPFHGELQSSIRDSSEGHLAQSLSPHRSDNIVTDSVRTPDMTTDADGMSLPSPSAQAPPPYLNSMNMDEQEGQVTHPPPYMDLLPSASHT